MQNRADRIHFPQVDSESLWKDVCTSEVLLSPGRSNVSRITVEASNVAHSPLIITPGMDSPHCIHQEEQGVAYFKERERNGIVTPAKTPSDILRRGPLYAESSASDTDILSHIAVSPNVVSCSGLLPFAGNTTSDEVDHIRKQIQFHQDRQGAIEKSILEFEKKMRALLDWHKDQELINTNLLESCEHRDQLSSSDGSTRSGSRQRRGRSRLSERLYAAIDSSYK